jgi:hypothetical protein
MSNRADSGGQWKNHSSKNILPDIGARLNRGNAMGNERGAMLIHRGRTCAEVRGGCDMGAELRGERVGWHNAGGCREFKRERDRR